MEAGGTECEAGRDRDREVRVCIHDAKLLNVPGREGPRAQASGSAESVKQLAPKFWQKEEGKEDSEEGVGALKSMVPQGPPWCA